MATQAYVAMANFHINRILATQLDDKRRQLYYLRGLKENGKIKRRVNEKEKICAFMRVCVCERKKRKKNGNHQNTRTKSVLVHIECN